MSRARSQLLFLVHEPPLMDHYREIWKKLDKSKFVIGLHQRMDSGSGSFDPDYTRYRDEIGKSGYQVMEVSRLLSSNIKFRWVISNHKMGKADSPKTVSKFVRTVLARVARSLLGRSREGSPGERVVRALSGPVWMPQKLGKVQIRMMYGADLSPAWSLQDWNQMYSHVLCHGPRDSELVSQKFTARCYQIGYPKYDRYFSDRTGLSSLRREFGLAPEGKVVLWLPTVGKNSLDDFLDLMTGLAGRYQIICRPHPLSLKSQWRSVENLRNGGITIDEYASREMVELMATADYLMTDSGGSPFGGLYLNMKVIRMVGPATVQNELDQNSTNDALRLLYPAISPADSLDTVTRLFEDEDRWNDMLLKARPVREEFFGPYDGVSAGRAITVLEQITQLKLRVDEVA